MQWKIGKVRITKVVELETVGSTRFILPLATNEEIRKLPWLIPHFANEEGRLKMSVHSLLVETPTRRIIVDTGLGNDKQGRHIPHWNNRQGRFLHDLAEAGYPQPDSVTAGPGASEITFAWDGHDRPITMDPAAHPEPVDRIRPFGIDEPASVAELTATVCKLVHDGGGPKPDLIKEGPEPYELSFIWTERKVIVIVDRREEPDASMLDDLAA